MKESLEYLLFLLLNRIAQLLSFGIAGKIGAFLGNATFLFTGLRRRITKGNLANAYPDKSGREIQRIAQGAYRNCGIALMEMLWAGRQSEDSLMKTIKIRNVDVLHDALARKIGLILLSAHYGSWELIISALRLHVGRPFVIVVQHQRNRKIDKLINSYRCRFDNSTVPLGPSVRELIKALQEGKVVAMLADQSGPKESIFVDFFGRPAATHRGAAAFSLKTGAPIVMAFLVRQQDGKYETWFEEVGQLGLDGYNEKNILELTRRHVEMLEKHIRLHPDHWLWMHKRWKHAEYYQSHKVVEEAA
ncbi:MAG: lysophospholipid acyltransferase family protein [Ignavibacteria bacterium]|nr:lysophospholipid acyltransferase family protein [Ignavibacteria bacterium]